MLRKIQGQSPNVEQIQKDIDSKLCSWAVGSAVGGIAGTLMKPIFSSMSEIIGWAAETYVTGKVGDASGQLICKY